MKNLKKIEDRALVELEEIAQNKTNDAGIRVQAACGILDWVKFSQRS